MEEQELLKETKRARNFIWAAAEDYELEPLFLAFTPEGTADLYLNLVIGLVYKWYDQVEIDAFFNLLSGKNKELYEGLLWIGLENAVYLKEKRLRPVLDDLRKDYARENLRRYRKQKEYSAIDRIRNGHCREILGRPSELKKEEQRILHAFLYTDDMSTVQILQRTRENLWSFFSYRPVKKTREKGIYFLQKVEGVFQSAGKMYSTYVRAKDFEDTNAFTEGRAETAENRKHYLMQISSKRDPLKTKRYVEACFGQSIYTESEQQKVERKLCTENHRNCHVLFTRGESVLHSKKSTADRTEHEHNKRTGRREEQEIREFQKERKIQHEKNKRFFMKNYAIYYNSIRRLTEKLQICLESKEEDFPELSMHGRIRPREIWKAVYTDNPRIFEWKEPEEIPEISVDILIDASSSRKQMQEQIAAQGYVLAKSLGQCRIPAQIYSYCSIRDYTVMQVFQNYDDKHKEEKIFQYVSAGNNRDGLAIRAAGHLMEKSPKSRKILLVLTDACPQDEQEMGEGAFYKNKEYTDLSAVQDTAKEVQKLKHKGILVVGIFMGNVRAEETADKIYGRELVKIQNINEFADAVGRVLQEVLR